jgi:hypothetical protein
MRQTVLKSEVYRLLLAGKLTINPLLAQTNAELFFEQWIYLWMFVVKQYEIQH